MGAIGLPPEGQNASESQSRKLPLPVALLSRFGNTLTLDFSFGNENEGVNSSANSFAALLKESSLDLSGVPHFTEMPNLSLFSEPGYPFTRFPDLARTAVVLPREASPEQIALSLAILAGLGAKTGSPGIARRGG